MSKLQISRQLLVPKYVLINEICTLPRWRRSRQLTSCSCHLSAFKLFSLDKILYFTVSHPAVYVAVLYFTPPSCILKLCVKTQTQVSRYYCHIFLVTVCQLDLVSNLKLTVLFTYLNWNERLHDNVPTKLRIVLKILGWLLENEKSVVPEYDCDKWDLHFPSNVANQLYSCRCRWSLYLALQIYNDEILQCSGALQMILSKFLTVLYFIIFF